GERAPRGRRLALAAASIFVAALLGVSAFVYFKRTAQAESESIAVMPFANVNSDPDTEYLSDGITEHLINHLSQLPNLRVIARTTAFSYKGRRVDPREAGRELNVGAVLVGEVTKRDDTLTIQTELVRVSDGSRLWGEKYSRPVSDLLGVQRDIAAEILEQLKLRLTTTSRQRMTRHYTENAEAYRLYLQGEYHRKRTTPEDLRRSVEYFQQAVQKDPGYAHAYVGLALAYRSLPGVGAMTPQEAYPRAKDAAERALALDPALASAHVPLASIKYLFDWNFEEAEEGYRTAIELNPNYAEAHSGYANFLTAFGRFDEAMREYQIAQQLDPLSVGIKSNVAWSLYVSGLYDEALARCRESLRLAPDHAPTHIQMGEIYVQQGKFEEAVTAFHKAKDLSADVMADIGLGHAYGVAGRRAEALKILEEMERRVERREVSSFHIATLSTGLGDKDKAFAYLERALRERSNWMVLMKTGPRLAPLRSDPRFEDILRRMNFPR
ncbi:MAG TPA: tetratricopeptide repeat protein, partial [Pyrinomonadaceae bacterium]|nr:tetratricopeptide repeat protein [Pyrinomonadaceae bacterium]